MFDIVILGVLLVLISALVDTVGYTAPVVVVSILIFILFAPRFILDLCKGLKYNKETGDLKEIEALKHRLDQLESKK